MSKEYTIKTSGYGSDVFVFPLTKEQFVTLSEGGVVNDSLSLDEIAEILEVDDCFTTDYIYNGVNANHSLNHDLVIHIYDEQNNIVWETDKSFEFDYADYEYVHDNDEACLLVQDIQKGTFMIYKLILEDDEVFDHKKLIPIVTQICDGLFEVISGLKYPDKEMSMDFGDNWSRGFNFYLYEI